jgi:hypothetical protein
MYHLVVLFFIVLFIINCKKNNLTEEPYINYQEISYQGSEVNCPQIHADNYQELTNNRQMIQPFGYTKNDLFHMTRFMKTDIPLPTDPDFFKHI